MLLNSLPSLREYNAASGRLLVEHAYLNPATPRRAHVDVNIVLEASKRDVAREGTWLNVIGYVRTESTYRGTNNDNTEQCLPVVQAVLMWDAGAIDVKNYEKILQQQAETRTKARGILQKAHKALDRQEKIS
jgi:hypothetical protein